MTNILINGTYVVHSQKSLALSHTHIHTAGIKFPLFRLTKKKKANVFYNKLIAPMKRIRTDKAA